MRPITLILPYPISANSYWRHIVISGQARTLVSKEAKEYKQIVGWKVKAVGVKQPISGRVQIDIKLYPSRPQDWKARMRKHGDAWDDGVLCIDLDNANKVLLDALKGVAIEDDKWVRRIVAERMEPDAEGARVVLTITPLAVAQPQAGLFGEAA